MAATRMRRHRGGEYPQALTDPLLIPPIDRGALAIDEKS